MTESLRGPERVPDIMNTGLSVSLNKDRGPMKSVGRHVGYSEKRVTPSLKGRQNPDQIYEGETRGCRETGYNTR